ARRDCWSAPTAALRPATSRPIAASCWAAAVRCSATTFGGGAAAAWPSRTSSGASRCPSPRSGSGRMPARRTSSPSRRTWPRAGQTLWETLVAQKVVNDEQILTALSTRFRLKLADVKEVDLTVKEKVPEQLARRYQILPLRVTDSFLEIATANPFDLDAEKALAFATAREIRMQLLAPSKISEKLDEVYRPEKALDKMFQQMEGSPELVQLVEEAGPDEIAVSEEQASQRPIVRLVDLIISEAILARSSDIHIEPEEGGVAVRYRIDGVLRQQMKIPRQAGLPLISRIKIMSSLDIADRLRPQD